MKSLLPKIEKLDNESVEGLFVELKETIVREDNECGLNEILSKLMVSSPNDFKRLDAILAPAYKQFNDELVDKVCIIFLNGIDFNFGAFMHKLRINEKQNIKIDCIKIREGVFMPNFRKYLEGVVRRKSFKMDLACYRVFVVYLLLSQGGSEGEGGMDSGGMDSGGMDSGRMGSGRMDSDGMDSVSMSNNPTPNSSSNHPSINGLLSPSPPLTIKPYLQPSKSFPSLSILSLLKPPTDYSKSLGDLALLPPPPFAYRGTLGPFYFLQYLLTGDPLVLSNWLIKGKIKVDWEALGLPLMEDFVVNELRYVRDTSLIYSTIIQCKSHYLLSKFILRFIFRFGYSEAFKGFVLDSFDPTKTHETIQLMEKLYKEDYSKTNHLLKDLLIKTKSTDLLCLFQTHYKVLDKNYFEVLKAFPSLLQGLSKLELLRLLESEHFAIVLKPLENLKLVIESTKTKGIERELKEVLTKMKWRAREEDLKKLEIICKSLPVGRVAFERELGEIIEGVYKGRCIGCADVGGSMGPFQMESTLLQSKPPSLYPPSDTPLAGLPKDPKKYKIKPKKTKEVGDKTVFRLIDLVFVVRNPNLNLKKVFKLSPSYFTSKVTGEDEAIRDDVFFVRALNLVLKGFRGFDFLSTHPVIQRDDYWGLGLRRAIKTKGWFTKGTNLTNTNESKNKIYLLPDSTLRESYLDLSQINDSTIRIESEIDRSLYKLLSNRDLLKYKGNPKVDEELERRNKVPFGILMKKSFISIVHPLPSFTLCLKVYQLESSGNQTLVELKGGDKSFKVGTVNGKLYQETQKDSLVERKLLGHDLSCTDYFYLELVYKSKSLKIIINDQNYSFVFVRVDEIVIGSGFRGVLNKLLLFEGTGFKNSRIVNLDKAYLYLKIIHKLERYLKYHNRRGLFMDSLSPFCINGGFVIRMENVLEWVV